MPRGRHAPDRDANAHLDEVRPRLREVPPGDYVVLAVTDTGIGMAPEVRSARSSRSSPPRAPGGGSGLGLSMVYGFAKQSGGHLRIDSELGHGTTVRLYLPRPRRGAADNRRGDAPRAAAGTNRSWWSRTTRRCARSRTGIYALGYQVSEAGERAGGAGAAPAAGIDLLFTDVVMPEGMTGISWHAARQLQPDLKVLFTTGYAGRAGRPEPAHAPAGATLLKPYRRQDLGQRCPGRARGLSSFRPRRGPPPRRPRPATCAAPPRRRRRCRARPRRTNWDCR